MKTVKIINKQSPFYGKEGLATKHQDHATGDVVIAVYIDGNQSPNLFYQNEIAVIGDATVYDAVRLAYNQIMSKEFPVRALLTRVRSICERPELMDGTILRRLRELREDGRINFICIDNHKAIYQKA